jgi:outer membrane protein assembly factor BamD
VKRILIVGLLGLYLLSAMVGCGSKNTMSLLTGRQLYEIGMENYNKKKYRKAVEYLQNAIYNFPGESMIDSAQYFLSMSYFGNEEYALAYTEFNRLALNYPTSTFFEHSLFMRALSQYKETPNNPGLDQSALQPAIKQFEDFLLDYPESEVAPQVKEYLLKARTRIAKKIYDNAVVYERIRAFDAAESYFQRVIDEYSETPLAAQASYKIGYLEFKRGRLQTAKEKLQAYVIVFPQHEWVPKATDYLEKIEHKLAEDPPDSNAKS